MRITQNGPQSISQVEKYFSHGNLFLSPEEYQRESAWDVKQKILLIDSIFREYDIPKFYFWKIDLNTINAQGSYPDGDTKNHYRNILNNKVTQNNDSNPYIFEVVDGQQRIRTILEFMGKNPPNTDVYRGRWNQPFATLPDTPISQGRLFSILNPEQQLLFESKTLSIVVLEDTTISEVRDMFLRLQNGTPLNAQQKRDALGSRIGKLAKKIAEKNFLSSSVNFQNLASDYNRLASQMINLELRGQIETCTSKQLDKIYKDNINIPANIVTKCNRVNDVLFEIFPQRCPNINRSYALSLYWIISKITENYSIPNTEFVKIKRNFISLDDERLIASQRDYSNANDEIYEELSESMSRSTDGKEGIEIRHKILGQFLFENVNLIPLQDLDPIRNFSFEEKLLIFSRDNHKCQLECNGLKCDKLLDFNDAVIDHINPHSLGGRTVLSNGRLSHRLCNISRGNRNTFNPETDCVKP